MSLSEFVQKLNNDANSMDLPQTNKDDLKKIMNSYVDLLKSSYLC